MTTGQGRAVRILAPDTIIERRPGGVLYARSPHPLGAYPAKLTERLEHWAAHAPDRTFIAERDGRNQWRALTYAGALTRVRAVAQALLDRGLSNDRPIVVLSGNGIEHAVLGLAAMYAGVLYAPVAPAYSLAARDYTTLRLILDSLTPGLIFVADAAPFDRAIASVTDGRVEVVSCVSAGSLPATAFAELEASVPTADVDAAHARVGPETIAKILYTSGSTGKPKGVINTQRMLCANQEMLRTVMPLLCEEPPVLCDWLPWNHTFGGNHNVGLVLYNGGTLYVDAGKPTPDGFSTTLANLREIATTAYFNVPRGYDLLVPQLRDDEGFRRHFFSRMKMLFCAAASLRQQIADDLRALAIDASGERIPLVTGLGATESAPFALCAGSAAFTGGRIGVPVPGVELKLAPAGQHFEGRLRGPNITPGYWRDEPLTRAAFDEEGFYKLGDALRFFDAADPARGFAFEGRLAEDFKLSTGTWVRVGPLRGRILASLGELVQDVVISGHDRDFVGALIFPSVNACRALCGVDGAGLAVGQVLAHQAVRQRFHDALADLARDTPGTSTSIARAILLEEPPSIDAQELTDKGTVNQKAVLARRVALVDEIYGPAGTATLIEVGESADVS
jgi:feruloyl-CoA synthase